MTAPAGRRKGGFMPGFSDGFDMVASPSSAKREEPSGLYTPEGQLEALFREIGEVEPDLAVMQKCLANGAPLEGRNKYGLTPLMQAAWDGKLEAVKFFVKEGALLDAKDLQGDTALFYAVSKGRLDVVMFLVDQGADLLVGSPSEGKSIYGLALARGHQDVADYLRDRYVAALAKQRTKLKTGFRPGPVIVVKRQPLPSRA